MNEKASLGRAFAGRAAACPRGRTDRQCHGWRFARFDKISGDTIDLEIAKGDSLSLGNLQISMVDCRYPAGDPAANAYAALEITEEGSSGALFSGWMIASAPALHALEHFRYDIWVMRCSTS